MEEKVQTVNLYHLVGCKEMLFVNKHPIGYLYIDLIPICKLGINCFYPLYHPVFYIILSRIGRKKKNGLHYNIPFMNFTIRSEAYPSPYGLTALLILSYSSSLSNNRLTSSIILS